MNPKGFLLDPSIVFLNHGSFGACPEPVFEAYQAYQRELEAQPIVFLDRAFRQRMAEARASLAAYLGADPDDIVYVSNATTGLNIVARSLRLSPGDEVLTTNHEYGALDRTWTFLCEKQGASYVRAPVSVPILDAEAVVEAIWSCVTPRTRVLFLSHITSFTGLILPIRELIARARDADILTLVDGAHAPGQIPLDLDALGADAYAGNCHKWMLAPKGSAFLHVRREHHNAVEPLVVSWGWRSEQPGSSRLVDYCEWQGTRDPSAFLAVGDAIRYMEENNWEAVRASCHRLALEARGRIAAITGLTPLCPGTNEWIGQMVSCPVPVEDADGLKARLYDVHRIEIPVIRWEGMTLVRVSVQAYNDPSDLEALYVALEESIAFFATKES